MASVKVLLILLISVLVCAISIPQVPLCSQDDCPTVSRIGLGTLHIGDLIGGLFDPLSINKWIRNGLSNGITLLDCADVYPLKGGIAGDSAKLIGKALALTPGLRKKFTIVAKMDIIFPSTIDTSREHLQSKVDWFLGALQTDYLDIVLLHYPNSFMNATEVAQFFIELKGKGIVNNFGVSNHYPSHFDVLQSELSRLSNNEIHLVTNEIEISVWNPGYLNYNNQLVDHAYKTGYRNLGWGGLAGDPLGGINRLFNKNGTRQVKILGALTDVGTAIGEADNARVALAWTLSHPSGIIPLIGTTQIDRVTSLTTDILELSEKFTSSMWWSIGKAGGLCPLADSECNYADYKANN